MEKLWLVDDEGLERGEETGIMEVLLLVVELLVMEPDMMFVLENIFFNV